MAVAQIADVFEWEGRLVAVSANRTSRGYRVLTKVFGPLESDASNAALGALTMDALDHVETEPDSVPIDRQSPGVTSLGARNEREFFRTGRVVAVSRRDGATQVRAQGTDGGGFSGTTDMPRVTLDSADPAGLGAAVREMLAAFTHLEPEEPGHT